jgi:hypothetical protein
MEDHKMLKTNSKKARENLQRYILANTDVSNYYDLKQPETFKDAAKIIIDTFRAEYYSKPEDFKYWRNNEKAAFESWTSGLPSILDCCYWYNRPAVDDLGNILDQTKEERNKYSEESACKMLTKLIYREIVREA